MLPFAANLVLRQLGLVFFLAAIGTRAGQGFGTTFAKGGGPLKQFTAAGEDKKFVWADAVIDGKTVLVSSPAVPRPVAVRYGWDANPTCNLFNQENLPAVPFRTDDWK